jgi:hypothetical protein
MKKTLLWLLVFGFTVALSRPSAATVWLEIGDAGLLPGTAQNIDSPDLLDSILGNLGDGGPDSIFDIDMFRIHIFDPLIFSAMTIDSPFNVSDSQLFLFGEDGRGIYMNDDDESGLNGSQSLLPAGHPLGPISAGFYYLAIGWWDNEPFGAGGRIFEDSLGVSGPDFLAGGFDPVLLWDNNVSGRIDLPTSYQINLTGAGLDVQVPEPGTLVLFGLGLIAAARRLPSPRRRHRL